MADLVFLLATVIWCGLLIAFTYACDKL